MAIAIESAERYRNAPFILHGDNTRSWARPSAKRRVQLGAERSESGVLVVALVGLEPL